MTRIGSADTSCCPMARKSRSTCKRRAERQIILLGKHTVRWMRLERMQKSDDPSAFPALTEWEVYGCDKEGE